MKKLFLFSAFMAAMVPAMAQQVKYSVSGTCAHNGKTIYLEDKLTERMIDSVVVANGKFTLSGTAQKDAFMGLHSKNKEWEAEFFNDGTPLVVNVDANTLKGSPLNERLSKYENEAFASFWAFKAKASKMTDAELKEHEEELMVEYDQALREISTYTDKVFKEERQSLIPLAFAQLYFMDNGIESYDELIKQPSAFANHPYLKKAKDDMAEMLQPKDNPKTAFIGQQFTDLEMADPDGKMHKISDLVGEGKWVLVDFWASWCAPCRAEMPNVLKAYNEYHAKGFEVIGISFDEKKAAWIKAVEQIKMPWLQLSDLKGFKCAAAPIYKVDGIPDNILIDPQGKITDRGLRGKALHNRLQKIFGE